MICELEFLMIQERQKIQPFYILDEAYEPLHEISILSVKPVYIMVTREKWRIQTVLLSAANVSS